MVITYSLSTRVRFGRYKNYKLSDIMYADYEYFLWFCNQYPVDSQTKQMMG